jgi:hypothetical protein
LHLIRQLGIARQGSSKTLAGRVKSRNFASGMGADGVLTDRSS